LLDCTQLQLHMVMQVVIMTSDLGTKLGKKLGNLQQEC
jgi:hypothetical protein